MSLLRSLRVSSIGLRARIVGVVVVTTAVTLGVAAIALMPRLESTLRNAAMKTLQNDVHAAKNTIEFTNLTTIPYQQLADPLGVGDLSAKRAQMEVSAQLGKAELALRNQISAQTVTLIGYIDERGEGRVIQPLTGGGQNGAAPNAEFAASGNEIPYDDVRRAYLERRTVYSFNSSRSQVRASIWLGNTIGGTTDAVLTVTRSIDEVPAAVKAVQHAAMIAAIPGLLLTLMLAIPLAATLVRRLQLLREAALRLAVDGAGEDFPVDRSRDEIGDLSRSFAIVQRRLRQQEQARRSFVATASHELRTPLTSLSGMLELLDEDLSSEPIDLDDARELLDRAREQSRRLAGLASDLLDLSRLDAEVVLRSEPVELTEVARAVQAEFDDRARAEGDVRVVLDLGSTGCEDGVWALADPGSVARIVRILIDNALRVAPPGSEIRVAISSQPTPTLSVTDAGPGVPRAERALIFERFQRGRSSSGKAGFGLGLAIGRELAHRMAGSLVLVDDDSLGTTFRLRLPPVPPAAPEV